VVERLRALHVDTPAVLICDAADSPPAKRLVDASVLDVLRHPLKARELLGWIECVCVTRLVLTRQHLLRAVPCRQNSAKPELCIVA
jgi:hypothetical protein